MGIWIDRCIRYNRGTRIVSRREREREREISDRQIVGYWMYLKKRDAETLASHTHGITSKFTMTKDRSAVYYFSMDKGIGVMCRRRQRTRKVIRGGRFLFLRLCMCTMPDAVVSCQCAGAGSDGSASGIGGRDEDEAEREYTVRQEEICMRFVVGLVFVFVCVSICYEGRERETRLIVTRFLVTCFLLFSPSPLSHSPFTSSPLPLLHRLPAISVSLCNRSGNQIRRWQRRHQNRRMHICPSISCFSSSSFSRKRDFDQASKLTNSKRSSW